MREDMTKLESAIIVKVGEIRYAKSKGRHRALSVGLQPWLGEKDVGAFEVFSLPNSKGGVIEVGDIANRHVISPSAGNGELTNE